MTTEASDAQDRLQRLQMAYVGKVNAVLEAGREDLANELAEDFAVELSTAQARNRRAAGRGTPTRTSSGQPPRRSVSRLRGIGRFTRTSRARVDS